MNSIEALIEKHCPDGVDYRSLGAVATIAKGVQLNKEILTQVGNFPVLNGGVNPSGYYHEYNTLENTITVSQGGASAGYVNFIKKKFYAGAHCFITKPVDSILNNKFLYYALKQGQPLLQNAKLGAGIPGLSTKELSNFQIPIPPIVIQLKIVKILDAFEALINDISIGLPAEIKARRTQYEYYRKKLLTFPVKINPAHDII